MELEVYNISGQKTAKKVKLDDNIFGIKPNDHAIYLDVKQYMANHRQGTHKAKERSEVAGSTRKIKRQKGTGTARFGDIKNPLFRGGGRVFGPQPRDYGFKLNKKLKKLARKSALTYKAQENSIIVLEDFTFEKPKTKQFIEILQKFELKEKKVLVVLAENDKNIYLSSRNLQKAKIVSASDVHTYDILNANNLLIAESSLKEIEKIHSVN
ncbi:MAG: 50S ribosomal protein L4 [Bacteroidales bacterium]|nr:50S ribosomal protein L4 [Bacteroidales bacterium]